MQWNRLVNFASVAAVSALVAPACFGGDSGEPDPTQAAPAPSATAIVEASATPALSPTPPPPSPTALPVSVTGPVPRTIWLIEADGGGALTLFESYDATGFARFNESGDTVLLAEGGIEVEYGLDGDRIGPVFQPEPCQFKADGEQINGRRHPTFQCESAPSAGHPFLSPSGEWFTYQVEAGSPAATPVFPPVWDMWALNLRTNERRLVQAGLQDCGGCDGRFGPDWSPSGRYYFFSETGGAGRVFLADFETGTTTQLTTGNQLQDSPDWAPDKDVLLYRSPPGTTIHHDLTTGTRRVLDDMPWPARFDVTGSAIYAPAFGHPSEQQPQPATTVRSSDLVVTVRLEGVPEYTGLFRELNPIVGEPGIAAALSRAPGCDGIALYASSARSGCIEGGLGATLSPDGTTLAVTRVTGVTGQVSYPGGAAVSLNVYDILLVDVATGAERVVADRAIGWDAPLIAWNAGSSHVLVQWPYVGGL